MGKSISASAKKKRGRPVTTGTGTTIGVRCQDEMLAAVDEWRRKQSDLPTRATAIRRLAEIALKLKSPNNLTMKDSDGRILLPAGGLKAKGK